ncbi:MAG: Cd(II)/Pb(II)-responsive transcriptional regulator [Desulfovibrio sp.]|nr:Cd(II)/Pb(II)-responsive transcriptional regulator [Desulfovibrio sp.]
MKVKIGELARLTGCQTVTIRYYEQEGLLAKPERTEGNYRIYDAKDVERLRFIRHCRLIGMTLAEIRDMLAFRENPNIDCEWITFLMAKHIEKVDVQIAELTHLKRHLQALLGSCPGGKGKECGILKNLDSVEECPYCKNLSCGSH